MHLKQQLLKITTPELFFVDSEYQQFLKLLQTGKLVKSESPEHHVCVFFIPFNPVTKEILIVHHKKAKQWIVPGGHIEAGELLEDAVRREAQEELGLKIEKVELPFLMTIMDIENVGRTCTAHYDVWYRIPTQEKLKIDPREFHETKWVTKVEARSLITHPTYLTALEKINDF